MNTRRRSRPNLTAGIGALLLAATPAFAATWTWTGAAGNNSWNNSGNWSPVSPPANIETTDIIFGATPRPTPDLTLSWLVNSLTFNNTAPAYSLISTAGNTLFVGAGGITNNDANDQTISHAISLAAPQTWSTVAGSIDIFSAVQNNGNLLTMDVAGGTGISAAGVINGSGGLTKTGPGSLLFQAGAANSYTGTTTVNAGSLQLNGVTGAAGIPGALVIGDGVDTDLDVVFSNISHKIADNATVSILSTGSWDLNTLGDPSETITNLNIVSTGIGGGGSVWLRGGTLTLPGALTMTGGLITTASTGTLLLQGGITTNASSLTASISSKLDLGGGPRILVTADGAAPADLAVTGVVSNGAILKGGSGALRLGAANTYAGGTTLNAGTILIGHDSALGTGPLISGLGTIQADGAARTIANVLSGSVVVDGAFDLTLNSPVNTAGNITKNGAAQLIFAQPATFGGLTINTGTVRFDAAVTFTAGLTNSATLLPGTHTLTVNGAGINNQSVLVLDGNTLAGSGPVVNNGAIFGFGTIGGSGGFTNHSLLSVSGGHLTLANTGSNVNAGNLLLPGGLQLRLTAALANTGTIDLANGIVAGTAMLSNNTGGSVSGRGLISAPFANAGGTLHVVGGTMNVTSAFASSGVIRLDDGAALAGGAITNTGRIQGDGSISSAVTNGLAGSIRVDAGDALLFTGAFAPNAGQWNLQGGTLDFPGAVTNSATGFITGRGALFTGSLTNNGQMAFSGGSMDPFGDVLLTAGARVATSGAGSVTTFWDDVVHNGTEIFTGAACSTVFYGGESGGGSFTGIGTIYFIGDLRPGNSPASISFAPRTVFAPSTVLTLELGGLTAGIQHDKLTFTHAATPQVEWGGTLTLTLINGFTPAAGQSFDVFEFDASRDAGSFSTITLPNLTAGLVWDTSQLYTTGTITVIPAGLTFAQWAATVLGDPAATPGGDHDNDGYDNATEFAFGLFPPQPGTVLPNGGFHTYIDGERLRLRFTRPLDRTGVTLKVQASDDLATWTDLATSVDSALFTGPGFVSENRSHPLSEPGLVEVRDILSAATAPRRQIRVQITLTP